MAKKTPKQAEAVAENPNWRSRIVGHARVRADPSCVQIGAMGDPRGSEYRIHHKINWNKAVPKIIAEKHRKKKA